MAINVQHIHTCGVEITYRTTKSHSEFRRCSCGTMDEITERVAKDLINHSFDSADVCDIETGEVLMIIERT